MLGNQPPIEPEIAEDSQEDDDSKPKAKKQTSTHIQQNMKLFWEGSNHIKLRNNILNNNL